MATTDRRKTVPPLPGTPKPAPTTKAPRTLPPPTTPGANAEIEGMRRDRSRDVRSADDPNGARSRGPARRQEEGWKAGQPAPSTVARREERAAAKATLPAAAADFDPGPAAGTGGRRGGRPGGGIMGFAQRMGWNPGASGDGESGGLGGVSGMMALAENINGGALGVPADPGDLGEAPTVEGIQAQIEALTAQLATLTGGAPVPAPIAAPGAAPVVAPPPVAPLPPTAPRTMTARKPRYGGV